MLISCLSLAALALGGCGDEAPSLREAREFDAYDVYYAGSEVAGFPLEEVLGEDRQSHERRSAWVFIYGKCVDPPDEGGCPPPVQIHNYSTCSRWPAASNQGRTLYDFRGAKARASREFGYSEVEIFTGSTAVKIAGERKVVKAAARTLRPVAEGGTTSRLPPPVPGSLAGKLPCQDDWGY